MDGVDLPRTDRQVVKTFETAEARSFLAAVRTDPLEAAYLLALLCGLRRGEVLGLRWTDTNFEQQTLTVARALERINKALAFVEPKSTAARRVLPLPVPVITALRAHRARQNEARLQLGPDWPDGGLIFPNGLGKPLEPRTFSRRFKTVLKDAKLPPTLRLHDCRHYTATAMIADGTDPRTVAGLLGHADPSLTLRTYAHVVSEAARKASDRMGALAAPEPPAKLRK
jgi:integrase